MKCSRVTRRSLITAGALLPFVASTEGWAVSRPRYGGVLNVKLPLAVSSVDPHDPSDILAALIGRSLFQPLYARTNSGLVYSTLAEGLPSRIGKDYEVRLRSGLRFASGQFLTSKDVVSSLERSKRLSASLASLPSPRAHARRKIRFRAHTGIDAQSLAQSLSRMRAAIVPHDFDPRQPDGSGAFVAQLSRGQMHLKRNPLAPRGGAYLDAVTLQSSSVREALRDFESTKTDLSILGAGLYQPRKGSKLFRLDALGLVVLVPSEPFARSARPGQLHAQLAHLPNTPFAALGVRGTRQPPAKWGGKPFSILVDEGQPWLGAIADEMKTALARSPSDIRVERISRSSLERRRTRNDFDTWLGAIATSEMPPEEISAELFRLENKRLPKSGGRTPPPLEAARLLQLGIVGELAPEAAHAGDVLGLVGGGRLNLENARRSD